MSVVVLAVMATLITVLIWVATPRFSTFDRISLLMAIFGIIIAVLSSYTFLLRKYSLPQQYNVGIVGFPQSGKTTLVISIFGETFAGNIQAFRISPRGTSTIERVNTALEMLKKGRALGPTTDQDRFAFRADVTAKSLVFQRTYKVEFGDFPGMDSKGYAEKYGPWLHTTEFFKWVADSDAMIFVVDLGHYLKREELKINYVAEISSALRAAWQHFLDINEHRMARVRRHPLVLVFSKADLFGVIEDSKDWDLIEQEITKLGFGSEAPPIKDIDAAALNRGESKVRHDFAELLDYFEKEAPNFRVVFTSSFGWMHGKRLGIDELLQAVLPH